MLRLTTLLILLVQVLLLAAGALPAVAEARDLLKKPAAWYASPEARALGSNVVANQCPAGGWPKNMDTTKALPSSRGYKPTFDNSATTGELRFLALLVTATGEAAYRQSFLKGYDYIINAQYPNGGWPQSFPPDESYSRFITFNDDAMVRLLTFLRESTSAAAPFRFLDEPRRARAHDAFRKGVECVLRCQIKIDGRLTAWCAQHDEKDFSPRRARTYELPSLSGAESAGITRFLMSIDQPTPEVVAAVEAAVTWFESAKIVGVRMVRVPDERSPRGTDKRLVNDPDAPPLWARFYDLKTNRPFYCDRDGVPKPSLDQIGYERRNGYAWLGDWPEPLLTREYPEWRRKHNLH